MRESEFIEFLPHTFDSEISHQIFLAFHKDPLIASYLNPQTLADWQGFAGEKLRYWQPGLFALSSLDLALAGANLRDLDTSTIPDYLLSATKVLHNTEILQNGLSSLREAVLLALLLRDYRHLNQSWSKVSQFMSGVEGGLAYWETPTLILSRIVPDFDLFVDTLLQATNPQNIKAIARLIVNANECTVMPLAHRLEYYRALFELKPFETQVAGLEALSTYQSDEIIRNLANSFLPGNQPPPQAINFNRLPSEDLPIKAAEMRQEAQLFALAGKGKEAGAILSQASDLLQELWARHLAFQAESLKYLAPEESALASRQLTSIKNFREINPWPSSAVAQPVGPFAHADLDSILMKLADQPENPKLLQCYADLLLLNDQVEEAVIAAQKAINLGLNDPDLINWFCAFSPRSAETDENIQVILDGLKLSPHNLNLLLALAHQFSTKGDKSSVVGTLERLAFEDNLDSKTLFEVAKAYQSVEELEAASAALDRGVSNFLASFTLEDFLKFFYAYISIDKLENARILADKYQPEDVGKTTCNLASADLDILQDQVEHAREILLAIAPPEIGKALSHEEKKYHLSLWGYYYRLARLEQNLGDLEAARRYAAECWKLDQIAPESYLLMLELALEGADYKSFDSLYNLNEERSLSPLQDQTLSILLWVQHCVQKWTLPNLDLLTSSVGEVQSNEPIFHLSGLSRIAWQCAARGLKAWFTHDWSSADAAFQSMLEYAPNYPILNLAIMNFLTEKMVARRNMQTLHVLTHLPQNLISGKSDETSINHQIALAGKYLPGEIISPALRMSQAVIQGAWQRGGSLLALVNTPNQAAIALSIIRDPDLSRQIAHSLPEDPLVQFQYALCLLTEQPAEAHRIALRLSETQVLNPLVNVLAAYASLKEPKTSLTHFEAALALWDDEPDWHAQAGIHLESLKRFSEAASHIEKAIQSDPENANYWQILGNIKVDENDFEGAKEYFSKAVNHFPDNAKALENLALINQHMGQYPAAVASLQKAAILEPRTIRYREKLTQLYFEAGDYQTAIDEANRILIDSEENPAALLVKVRIYIKRKIFEEAQHLIRRARLLVNDKVPFELAACEIDSLFNKKNALISSEKLLRDYPGDPRVIKNHAKFQIEAGYTIQAVDTLQKCLYLAPKDPEALLLLGQAFHALKNSPNAIKYFSEAIAIEPGMNDALIGIGQVYQEDRDLEKAIAYYEKALAISDTDPKAYHLAASVYREKKDYNKAELVLKEAIQKFPSDLNLKGQLAAVMAINLVSNMQESTRRK
jgi:tetratricopeptide (TPR) repeat protein